MNQQVVFLTDGGEDVRDLPLYLNPQSEQYLDWFHVTMRITVMAQMARSLRSRDKPDLATRATEELLKTVTEFGGYIRANASSIPNYGERHRAGETISSAFVESTVNQVVSKRMVKKQQMRWTPKGAHLLLQVRTKVLNDELAGVFQRWYPAFVAPAGPAEIQELIA